MTALATDLKARYQQDGFVVVEQVLAMADVAAIRDRVMEITAGQGAHFPRENIEFEPRPETDDRPVARKINHCAESDGTFMKLARDPRILDIVEVLLGPDIKLFGSQCFMKPAGGVEKPYHQDSAYFPIEPLALVTCWVALDDVTLNNGCLWVIAGSHRGELFDHSQPWQVGGRVDMQIPDEHIDRSQETPMTMAAGGCSFHHSKLLHRSGPNDTDRPRRGLAIHYMSSHSRWTHPTRPQPACALLRGRQFDGCV